MRHLAIKAENISKQYRLGEVGTGTLSHDLNRFWSKLRGKDDPYLKIGDVNDRTALGHSDYVWSLKDINFEIEQGDAVGIIGRNGAGKSTLLKLLSKVTKPTTGSFKVKGRIASLLEVGTGFNPEMTGRENIYMNGSILGMRRHEITRKFDEIVNFSGVEKYIDTPVKRYSSGMYVRLAFAVAAHLESEILIVDEVLAVGDSEFQKKCLGKMGDISKGDGRTVLFVSHNMGAIQSLCTKGIVLENGIVKYDGSVSKALDSYIISGTTSSSSYKAKSIERNSIQEISLFNTNFDLSNNFKFDDEINLNFKFNLDSSYLDKVELRFQVINQREQIVFTSERKVNSFEKKVDGDFRVQCTIPAEVLVPNGYSLLVALHIPNVRYIAFLRDVISFNIEETGSEFFQYSGTDYGCVFVKCNWRNT